MPKPKPADAVMMSAVVLAENLGIPKREVAKAALHVAITIAEEHGDPDRYLGALIAAGASHLMKGKGHDRT